MDREYTTRIKRLMADFGVTDFHFERRKKHPRFIAAFGDKTVAYTFPASGSDTRGPANACSDIKRMLGLAAQPKQHILDRGKRHRVPGPKPARLSAPKTARCETTSKPTWQEMLATIAPSLSHSS